jgi:hypothetical protein
MRPPFSTIAAPSGLSKLFRQISTAPTEREPRSRRKGSPAFKMRLSPEERARLEAMAGETPLATYVKFRLFNNLPDLAALCLLPGGRPATDTQLIAKLLAALGASRIANNLNQLARCANMGTLEIGADTEKEIREACAAVQAMRADLVAALGREKGSARA